jgi:hypothetical protein
MPSADQVPTKSSHSIMLWHKWVVLIAGSTGSAMCCSPSQPSHHAGCPARSRLPRKRDGLLVSLALDHHGPDHSRELVGERDSSNLGRPPLQQGPEPGPMVGAMHLGVTDRSYFPNSPTSTARASSIDGTRIRGKATRCTIKSRKQEGDGLELSAACASSIMTSNVRFSLKVLDDNNLVRSIPDSEGMQLKYSRCSI